MDSEDYLQNYANIRPNYSQILKTPPSICSISSSKIDSGLIQ